MAPFHDLTTYSYHDFLSTPSIVDHWEKKGQAVNSRNAISQPILGIHQPGYPQRYADEEHLGR